MFVADFHNHMYPPEYNAAIEKGPSAYKVTYDANGDPVLNSPGDYNIAKPGHRLVDVRLEEIAKAGVDKHILSLTCPGTILETPPRAVELSRLVNDAFAKVQREHGDHFIPLATLPLNDAKASVVELERATRTLGLKGATLFSNANGVPLSDKRFWPMYEKANEMELTFFIHPTYPVGVEAMLDYMLMPLVGFLADTTLAAASLVFSGTVAQFPKIKWVLGHLGGAVPYLAERFDRGFEAYPVCQQHIDRKPSDYLKQHFYYDTVNFDVSALQFAIDFAGVDHLVAGSDYPHLIGSMERMVSSINELDIKPAEKQCILSENAMRLLGM